MFYVLLLFFLLILKKLCNKKLQRRNRAAAKIQALWKAHKTREAAKKRNESIARFQRSFR